MYLLAQAGLLILALISPIPAPETTITLTMKMEEFDAAMVGVVATIEERDHSVVYGRCVSDSKGLCIIELNDDVLPDVVRGRLNLDKNGSRSFIVERGKDQAVTIPFTEFGQVVGQNSHEPHPTVESFEVENLPTLPPAEAVATAIPTTEFVVVDPEEYETATPQAVARNETDLVLVEEEAEEPAGLIIIESADRGGRPWGLIVGIIGIFLVAWIGVILIIRSQQSK